MSYHNTRTPGGRRELSTQLVDFILKTLIGKIRLPQWTR
jgi:hypothetical protein